MKFVTYSFFQFDRHHRSAAVDVRSLAEGSHDFITFLTCFLIISSKFVRESLNLFTVKDDFAETEREREFSAEIKFQFIFISLAAL